MFNVVKKATLMTQDIIRKIIKTDDRVIDGTLGKGNDSIFLSEMVPSGKVFSFEVQKEAVDSFVDLMKVKNIKNINVIYDGHQNIHKYVYDKIGAAMFNLGYLPGGDPKIITQPETTLKALSSCLDILRPGGIITIALYTGHQGGEDEAREVKEFAQGLNPREYSVMDIHYTNKADKAPYIIVIERNDNYNACI